MELDKICVVTGSSGGIGKSICNKFLNLGWTVIGIDIDITTSFDNVNTTKNNIKYYQCDISNPDMISETVKQIISEYNYIDLLVNNAALQVCKSWSDYNVNDWDKIMNVNVRSGFLLSKSFKPAMKTGSNIVNICSVHSIATSKNIGVYAVSKGAMLTMTKSLSLDFIDCGIRVNSISPGAIDTQMLRNSLSRHEGGFEKLINSTPIKRFGTPEEIADAVWFITKSDFMVGENMVIDGGASIKLSTE